MTPQVLKTPAAVEDLVEQAVYLAKRSPSIGERFLDAVEVSCELLRRSPELGGSYAGISGRLQDLRVKGFEQHLIFYRQIPAGIEVIRVLHGARDIGTILWAE